MLRIMMMTGLPIVLAGLLTACSAPQTIRLPQRVEAQDLAFAPDGSALVVRYLENEAITVQCRDMPGGKVRWHANGLGGLSGRLIDFSPDGTTVAVAEKDHVRLFAMEDGAAVDRISLDEPLYVLQCQFLPDNTLALLVGRRAKNNTVDLTLEIWRLDGTQAVEPQMLTSHAHNAQWWRPFSADGRWLAYRAGSDLVGMLDTRSLERWDLHLEDLPYEPEMSGYSTTLALAPAGDELALGLTRFKHWTGDRFLAADEPLVVRIDVRSGDVIASLPSAAGTQADDGPIYLTYDPRQRYLAAGLLESQTLLLYNLGDEGAPPSVLCQGDKCCWREPTFSPDSQTLLALCRRKISRYDTAQIHSKWAP